MRKLIAAAALFAAFAPAAVAQSPGGAADSYIVGGFRGADDWQFIMGPKGAPDMSLKLVKVTDEGAVGFLCDTEGTRRLGVTIPDLTAEAGEQLELKVSVGRDERLLRMKATGGGPETPTVLEAEGQAVPAILGTMGAVPQNLPFVLRFDAGESRVVSVDLTTPRDIAATAAVICRGWAAEARP